MRSKTIWMSVFILAPVLVLASLGCDEDDDDDKTPADGGAPYIYLYPEEAGEVDVTLTPTEGGFLMESDPPYDDGWTVWAEPSGLIDGEYEYLYYSARVWLEFQTVTGDAVPAEEIFAWFGLELPAMGLTQKEADDFVEYWSEHLPYAPCYLVYPQYNSYVDAQVAIDVDPEPDSVLRLWLVIYGAESCEPIQPAAHYEFSRDGFTVVEWGVVLHGFDHGI